MFDRASNQVHEYSFSLDPSLLVAKSGERPINDMNSLWDPKLVSVFVFLHWETTETNPFWDRQDGCT